METIGGSQQGIQNENLVWDTGSSTWVPMTQPLVNTNNLTVSSTTDLTKIGGVNVGTNNALYVQPGTGASFTVGACTVTTLPDVSGTVAVSSLPAVTGTVAVSNGTGIKIYDSLGGTYKGLQFNDVSPQVCAQPYLQAMAEGDITGHTPWLKIGYSPSITTTDSDLWGAGGVINFATAAGQWECVSSDNTQDKGTVIKSSTSTGGSTTALNDTNTDFTAATAVAAGDCIIFDDGTGEYGYVTGLTGTHQLDVAGGFSLGGSGTGARVYRVVDKSAFTGAQVMKIEYLTTAFATKYEFNVLNGTSAVPTVASDFYRVNSYRMIAAGSTGVPKGSITLRGVSGGSTYSYLTAGYTRARNSAYTVPAGKTLYIVQFNCGFGSKTDVARIYTRLTQNDGFRTMGIFYPYTEAVSFGSTIPIPLESPTKVLSGVDLKVSAVGTGNGYAACSLRGWLE